MEARLIRRIHIGFVSWIMGAEVIDDGILPLSSSEISGCLSRYEISGGSGNVLLLFGMIRAPLESAS